MSSETSNFERAAVPTLGVLTDYNSMMTDRSLNPEQILQIAEIENNLNPDENPRLEQARGAYLMAAYPDQLFLSLPDDVLFDVIDIQHTPTIAFAIVSHRIRHQPENYKSTFRFILGPLPNDVITAELIPNPLIRQHGLLVRPHQS